jgi:hypothetical protein
MSVTLLVSVLVVGLKPEAILSDGTEMADSYRSLLTAELD